ncbi:MAG: hypothetical protein ACMXYA_02480, partial [Candidatus Woesearchaeota archaeon]
AGDIKSYVQKMQRVVQAIDYSKPEGCVSLPFDESMNRTIKKIANQKKKLVYSAIVVVGIGGSNLGTQAVYYALSSQLPKESPEIFFAESADSQQIQTIMNTLNEKPFTKKKVLLVVVSKSGKTTETLANAQVLYNFLEKRQKMKEYVVTISDADSALAELAHAQGFTQLDVPKYVGGRFSVFSAVGMFVLSLLGFQTNQLRKGAKDMTELCLSASAKNPAMLLAVTQYLHYLDGKNIHDLNVFSSSLEYFGKWYRQLMAESLGKEYNLQDERILAGFTPTVSIGSTDLHSVGQLVFGGPRDKYITSIMPEFVQSDPVVQKGVFSELVPMIEKKSLHSILTAIHSGVEHSYEKEHIPYITLKIPKINEYYLGQLLQLYLFEVCYLGQLLNVDAFDQPNVESYKSATRDILEQ